MITFCMEEIATAKKISCIQNQPLNLMYLQPVQEEKRDSGEIKFFLMQWISTQIIITIGQDTAFPVGEAIARTGGCSEKTFVFIKTPAKVEKHWPLLRSSGTISGLEHCSDLISFKLFKSLVRY